MVMGTRIIWTPWRNQNELVMVRSRLYKVHPDCDEESEDLRRIACDQISAWKMRGSLPHAVESTWLLTEACLADELPGVSAFSIKAGYLTALSRYVLHYFGHSDCSTSSSRSLAEKNTD